MDDVILSEDHRDALQEVSNLAMGQAATRLSKLLNQFIELSVPRIRVVNINDAALALREMTGIEDKVVAVRQGFRSGIRGEALVICRSGSIGRLSSFTEGTDVEWADERSIRQELTFEIANIVSGACVASILEQFDQQPSFLAPELIGETVEIDTLFRHERPVVLVALLVEVNFSLENRSFRVHLVLLMTQESLSYINCALGEMLSRL